MMKRRLLAFTVAMLLAFGTVGCGTEENVEPNGEMFTDRDKDSSYDVNKSVVVSLSGDKIVCDSKAVNINGTQIVLSEEGTYIFEGSLSDGQIVVNAGKKDKLQIVLNNAEITSKTSAALYVKEADKVVVTLASSTKNVFANGGSFNAIDENNIDGTVFSKGDLSFNGSGSLTVTSPADHGIVCKDDLVFATGTYVIESASHGIDANDSVRIADAVMNVSAGKDGLRADNSEDTEKGFVYIENGTFVISSEGDGISASSYLQINDGTFDIVTGGGSENAEQKTSEGWGGFPGGMGGQGGMRPGRRSGETSGATKMSTVTTDSNSESTSIKGLKAAGDMTILGGNFTIDSADDAVHSNSSIIVKAGTFAIESGDDGFHADDTLTISGGIIDIKECYEGLEALHVKVEAGDIKMVCSDDGINAAGGTDLSGTGGFRGDDQFGGMGRPGGMGGPGGMSGNSDGSIVISGGNLDIESHGDGMDANGYLEITGGYTVVTGPTQGDTATLDYDTTGTITGGTFIGTGGTMMAQSFSDSEQGVFAIQLGNAPAGTEFVLTDSNGNEIVKHAPRLDFAIVIVSTEEMVKGEMYTISIAGQTGEFEAR